MKTINVKNIQDRIFMLHPNLVTTQLSFFLTANHCYNDIYEEYREFIKITFTHWNIVRDINIFVKDISVNNYLKLLDNCILKLSQYNLYCIYVNSPYENKEFILYKIIHYSNLDIAKDHTVSEIIENLKNSSYKTKE